MSDWYRAYPNSQEGGYSQPDDYSRGLDASIESLLGSPTYDLAPTHLFQGFAFTAAPMPDFSIELDYSHRGFGGDLPFEVQPLVDLPEPWAGRQI